MATIKQFDLDFDGRKQDITELVAGFDFGDGYNFNIFEQNFGNSGSLNTSIIGANYDFDMTFGLDARLSPPTLGTIDADYPIRTALLLPEAVSPGESITLGTDTRVDIIDAQTTMTSTSLGQAQLVGYAESDGASFGPVEVGGFWGFDGYTIADTEFSFEGFERSEFDIGGPLDLGAAREVSIPGGVSIKIDPPSGETYTGGKSSYSGTFSGGAGQTSARGDDDIFEIDFSVLEVLANFFPVAKPFADALTLDVETNFGGFWTGGERSLSLEAQIAEVLLGGGFKLVQELSVIPRNLDTSFSFLGNEFVGTLGDSFSLNTPEDLSEPITGEVTYSFDADLQLNYSLEPFIGAEANFLGLAASLSKASDDPDASDDSVPDIDEIDDPKASIGAISTDGNSVSISAPPILSYDRDLSLASLPLFEKTVSLPDDYFPSVTQSFALENIVKDGDTGDGHGDADGEPNFDIVFEEDFSTDPEWQRFSNAISPENKFEYVPGGERDGYIKGTIDDVNRDWYDLIKSPEFDTISSDQAFTASFKINFFDYHFGAYPSVRFEGSRIEDRVSDPAFGLPAVEFALESGWVNEPGAQGFGRFQFTRTEGPNSLPLDFGDASVALALSENYTTNTWYDVTVRNDPNVRELSIEMLRPDGTEFFGSSINYNRAFSFDKISIGDVQLAPDYAPPVSFAVDDILVARQPKSDETLSDYAITSERYAVSSDYEALIDTRYGESAALAEWETLSSRYESEGGDFLREAGMVPIGENGINGGAAVTVDGDRFWNADRHYFVSWGDVFSGFLSHDVATFGGEELHLGSWYNPRHLFVNLDAVGGDDETKSASVISGRIHGDPHLETLDGLAYDFQAAGEFILIETEPGADNPFQVQTRFEPWKGSDVVSVTTRMAVEVGDHVVEIDAKGPDKLLLDGRALTPAALESGSVSLDADSAPELNFNADLSSVTILLNDAGEKLEIANQRGFLNINTFLTNADGGNAGNVRGLLGDAEQDGTADDLALRDGTVLAARDAATLYGAFAESWRLDGSEEKVALFSNSVSFPDAFPATAVSVDDLPAGRRLEAEAKALDAGLEPGDSRFDAAVLDYALTGDEAFIEGGVDDSPSPEDKLEPTTEDLETPTFGVLSDFEAVEEGDSGTTTVEFEFYRTGDTSEAATLTYAIRGDVNSDDFATGTSLSGDITFKAETDAALLALEIAGDTMVESYEALTVTIVGTDVADAGLAMASADVRILNDDFAPVAEDDGPFTTDEDTAFTTSDVLANDTDPDEDALEVSRFDAVSESGAAISHNGDGTFDYDPSGVFDDLEEDETITDTFNYTVSDGNGGTETAMVSITVSGVAEPAFNLVEGTPGRDALIGTDGDDRLVAGGGVLDTLTGKGGADVFDFYDLVGNGTRDVANVMDFEIGVDSLGLDRNDVAASRSFAGNTYLNLAGGENDMVVLQGVDSTDELIFV